MGRRPACVSLAACGGAMGGLGDTAGREFRVASSRLRRRRSLGCRRLRPEWTGSLPPGGFPLKRGASSGPKGERGPRQSGWDNSLLPLPTHLKRSTASRDVGVCESAGHRGEPPLAELGQKSG